MDYRRQGNGWLTFFEHYWLLTLAVSAVLLSQFLSFITGLTGTRWVWCYGVSLVAAAAGVTLLFYSKLPLYQQRQFLTFGSGAIPASRRTCYRWGYRCIVFAVALLLCLLLSKPRRSGLTTAASEPRNSAVFTPHASGAGWLLRSVGPQSPYDVRH